jgi:hypothetical protein
MAKLSDTQLIVLAAASGREDGAILPLPATIRGGAITKVITGLITRGLAERIEDERLAVADLVRITREGLLAIAVLKMRWADIQAGEIELAAGAPAEDAGPDTAPEPEAATTGEPGAPPAAPAPRPPPPWRRSSRPRAGKITLSGGASPVR